MILQHTDSTAPQAAAADCGQRDHLRSGLGHERICPDAARSLDHRQLGPYYIARTQAVMDGTWASVNTWDGIGAGMVGIGEISDAVPADDQSRGLALKDAIAAGAISPSPAR